MKNDLSIFHVPNSNRKGWEHIKDLYGLVFAFLPFIGIAGLGDILLMIRPCC